MKKYYVILLLFGMSVNTSASGIKYIEYNKDRIPNITTAAGIATEIIFEPDEVIEYNTFGFEAAWNAQVVRDHILVFKSKDPQPQTNLIVHTDKRDYLFTVTVGNNEWTEHPDRSGAVYSMRMVYNDDQALANRRKSEEYRNTLRNTDITASSYVYANYDYRATANANSIIPTRTWDNGKITYIAFRPGVKRGVVFELDDASKAHLVNQNTEKNGVLIVHGIYERLIIRLGNQAVELRRNERYGQRENTFKTNVNQTVRMIDENAPSAFQSVSQQPQPIGDIMISTEIEEQN